MKIYIVRENVSGSIFRHNSWKWYSGEIFQDASANVPMEEHRWHIFDYGDVNEYSTHSTGVWGRFRRCMAPWLEQIVNNYRNHGALNGPNSTPGYSDYIEDTPFARKLVLDIQIEWPEIFNKSIIMYIGDEQRKYINSVAFQYLEIVESEFGSGGTRILPFHEYATVAMQNYFKKISKKRALGLPVH